MESTRIAHGAAALAVGVALILALAQLGAPQTAQPESAGSALDAAAAAVEQGADHVGAAELASLLLEGRARVVDLQTPAEFARMRLPGAVNLSLDALLAPAGLALIEDARQGGDEIVLVSHGMTHAAQAWMALAAAGRSTGVRVLEGGLDGFARDVLMPPSLRDPAAPPLSPADAVRFDELRRSMAGEPAEPAGPFAAEPASLAAPGVVSTAWLARNYGRVVLLDGRTKTEDYAAGHLPGARHLPASKLRSKGAGEHPVEELHPPEALAEIYGALGIGPETEVVAYADAKMHDAAHPLMGLFRLGHRRLAILDGGVDRWRAEGRLLAAGDEPDAMPAAYPLTRADDSFVASLAQVVRAQGAGAAKILDVRPADQFSGTKSTEARAGHIPGALNRPIALDLDGAAWRPATELRADYAALGVGVESEVIVTCRTGHQAALTWFTLRWLLGVEDARWFDGSWQEWAADPALPVALGE